MDVLVWVAQSGKNPDTGSKPVDAHFSEEFYGSTNYSHIQKARKPFGLHPTIPFLATHPVKIEALLSPPGEESGFPLDFTPKEPRLLPGLQGALPLVWNGLEPTTVVLFT